MADKKDLEARCRSLRKALLHAGKQVEAQQYARCRMVAILEAERDELGARLTEVERHVQSLVLNMEHVTRAWCFARRELAESAAFLRDF